MAAPASIGDLCVFLGRPAPQIQLFCIFCGNDLNNVDKLNFDKKALRLIWRGCGVYGACNKCCEFRAYDDCLKNTQCTFEGDGVEAVTGLRLQDVVVRCRFCLGLLTTAEKVAATHRQEPFHLVRKYWRGTCSSCLCKQE
ncbi:E6 [Canine papillomavirus 23]|nr:E6 [Canine papillomavirus 23]